jgi:hypothetical protein
MIDEFFTAPLSQQYSGFTNLKPKKKTEIMNNYFDTVLATQHDQLIQRAITQLVLLKSQQAELSQQVGQELFAIIYGPLRPPQDQNLPQVQDDNEYLLNNCRKS